jgi:hypothetical protein
MALKKIYCPTCGEEIYLRFVRQSFTYAVDEKRAPYPFKRVDNIIDDSSYLEFFCSEDIEHNIDSIEIEKYKEEIERVFYEKIGQYLE